MANEKNEKPGTIPRAELKELCEKKLTEAQNRCEIVLRGETDSEVTRFVQEVVKAAHEKVLAVLAEVPQNGITTLEQQQKFCVKIEKIVNEAKREMTNNIKTRDGSGVKRTGSQNMVRSQISQVLGEARQEIGQKYELKSETAEPVCEAKPAKKMELKEKLELLCCQHGLKDALDSFNTKSTEENPEFYSHVLKIMWPAFNALITLIEDITKPEENDKKHIRKKWSGIGACMKLGGGLRKFFDEMPFYDPKSVEEKLFVKGITDKLWNLALEIERINNNRKFELAEEDEESLETKQILDAAKNGPAEFYVAVRDLNIKKHGGQYTAVIKPENLPTAGEKLLKQLVACLKLEGETNMTVEVAEFHSNMFNLENIDGGAKLLLPQDLIALLQEREEPEVSEVAPDPAPDPTPDPVSDFEITVEETVEIPAEELTRQNLVVKIEEYFAKLDKAEEEILKAIMQVEEKRGEIEKIMGENQELLDQRASIETDIIKLGVTKKEIKNKLAILAKLTETISYDFDQEVANLRGIEAQESNLQKQALEISARAYANYQQAEVLNEEINTMPNLIEKHEAIKAKRQAFIGAVKELLVT